MFSLAIRFLRRPSAIARRVRALVDQGTSKELVKAWIREHDLKDMRDTSGLLAALLMVPASILMYYYFPWSPESILGHVARVAVYFLAAGLLSAAVVQPLEGARQRAATSVREILSASSDPSYNLLAAELARKDNTFSLIQEIQNQPKGGNPQMFVDKWVGKAVALGPDGLAEMTGYEDPRLRELAAVGLGRINEFGPMSRLLDDKEIRVRRAAAMALAAGGWTPGDPAEKSRFEQALAIPATPAGQVGETVQLTLVGLHACPTCGSSQTILWHPGGAAKLSRLAKGTLLGIGAGMITGSPELGAAVGVGLANAEAAAFDQFRCEACGNMRQYVENRQTGVVMSPNLR